MRILRLTARTMEKLLEAHSRRDLESERVASRIVQDVRRRGDAALFSWSRRLEPLAVNRKNLWVSQREFRAALERVSREFLVAVGHAARNIRAIARRQRPREWMMEVEPGVRVAQRVRPIESVGCYIPGGSFSLVSTLLMTVIPAQEAGVRKIIVASPGPSNELLAVAGSLGIQSFV